MVLEKLWATAAWGKRPENTAIQDEGKKYATNETLTLSKHTHAQRMLKRGKKQEMIVQMNNVNRLIFLPRFKSST